MCSSIAVAGNITLKKCMKQMGIQKRGGVAPRTQRAAGGKGAPVRDNSRTACSGSPLGHRFSAPALALALLASSALAASARAQSAAEYQVKAVFLYNFAKFVDWSSTDPATAATPIALCIMGENPFGDFLQQTIKGKTINERELVFKHLMSGQSARGCQMVFISASERRRIRPILESLEGTGILTVGETDGFARLGGVINFILEDKKVHFEINVDAAQRARLKISSKLLSLAKIVRDEKKGGKS